MGNARKTVGPYAVKPHEDNDLLFRIIDSENELAAIVGKMSFRLTPESCPEQLEHNKASARRIAACLNACEGVTTESIEECARIGGLKHIDQTVVAQGKKLRELTKQRDALLADLQLASETLRRYETLHRAKNTEESTAKAEVNAGLASRFEATIAAAKAGGV